MTSLRAVVASGMVIICLLVTIPPNGVGAQSCDFIGGSDQDADMAVSGRSTGHADRSINMCGSRPEGQHAIACITKDLPEREEDPCGIGQLTNSQQ